MNFEQILRMAEMERSNMMEEGSLLKNWRQSKKKARDVLRQGKRYDYSNDDIILESYMREINGEELVPRQVYINRAWEKPQLLDKYLNAPPKTTDGHGWDIEANNFGAASGRMAPMRASSSDRQGSSQVNLSHDVTTRNQNSQSSASQIKSTQVDPLYDDTIRNRGYQGSADQIKSTQVDPLHDDTIRNRDNKPGESARPPGFMAEPSPNEMGQDYIRESSKARRKIKQVYTYSDEVPKISHGKNSRMVRHDANTISEHQLPPKVDPELYIHDDEMAPYKQIGDEAKEVYDGPWSNYGHMVEGYNVLNDLVGIVDPGNKENYIADPAERRQALLELMEKGEIILQGIDEQDKYMQQQTENSSMTSTSTYWKTLADSLSDVEYAELYKRYLAIAKLLMNDNMMSNDALSVEEQNRLASVVRNLNMVMSDYHKARNRTAS